MSQLAIFGGPKAVTLPKGDIFDWPIITKEDEEACLEVLRRGGMSGTDVTMQFEKEFAAYLGCEYACMVSNGTAALHLCAIALDIKPGDEIIMPSFTFVSTANAFVLRGAKIVYVDKFIISSLSLNSSGICDK